MVQRGQRVYEALQERIVKGELAPGVALPEQEISQLLGASRTPIREALQRLAREGLVELIPGRGAFVSEISVPDIIELFQLREALEPLSARLASRARNRAIIEPLRAELDDAHTMIDRDPAEYYELSYRLDVAIVSLTQNARLGRSLAEIWSQVRRARLVASANPQRLHETVDEHRQILQAILSGDEQGAEEATRAHLRRSLRNILAMTSVGLHELLEPQG
jgi:DNA-binding GntR family transcriptional regulator